jgi:ABC-2 type transport system ATP-binding protein
MEKDVIRIENLEKSYGTTGVLRGISARVEPGEVIGYLGSNGAGKTTTVKILCGLIRDFTGSVTVLGHDPRVEDHRLKGRIGYVPENAVLYEQLTPGEYLELLGTLYGLPAAVTRERVGEYLELFGLAGERDHRMLDFSKGMKQKVHLVSGLLHDPEILFLDEPLGGLDANTVIVVKELIARLAAGGKTVFYCSHLMDVVEKVSTRVLLLDEGRIVADGSVEALKERHGVPSLEALFTTLTRGA